MGISKDKNNRIIFYTISMILIVMLWFVMHVFMINELPMGLHLDEAGMAYDAFCIANWGIDRYQNPFPVYFYNYGGGMSAMYVYLTAFLIRFFGTGTWVLRLVAVAFSMVTLICVMAVTRKVFGMKWAIVGGFLYCILPYFTMQSRFGLDCNLMLGMVSLSVWILILALERDKWYLYVADGILWGLTLYTYIVSYMVLPVFLGSMCIYLLLIRKINWRKLLMAIIPFALLALPLIIMSVITFFQLAPIVTPYFTIPCIDGGRMSEFSPNIIANLLTAIKAVFLTDGIEYNAISGFYTLYIVSLPFCLIGIAWCFKNVYLTIKKREFSVEFTVVCYFMAQLIIGSVKTASNINNMNGIFWTLLFFIVAGIRALLHWVKKFKRIVALIIVFAYITNFSLFAGYYFGTCKNTVPYLFSPRLSGLMESHNEIFTGNNIYLDAYYTYFLLERKIDPRPLNLTVYEEVVGLYNVNFHTINSPLPDDLTKYGIYIIQSTNYSYRDI